MKMKYISLAVISVVAASMFTTSCIQEEKFSNGASTGKVIIDVNTDKAVETKSGRATTKLFETVELENDGVSLFLSGTASLYDENPLVDRMATKGTIITTDNAEDGNAAINAEGQQFKVTVRNNNRIYHTINGSEAKGVVAKYDPNGVETKWPLLTEVDWPDQAPKALDFWAYYDAIGAATPSGDGYSTYAYTGPTTGKAGMDASRMSDFLVANTVGATQNNVAIHFYHALSAVRFHVDAEKFMEAKDDNNNDKYNSLKVIVSGIYKDGDVEYVNDPSKMYFHWDWTDEMKADASYEQILFDRSKAGQEGFDENGYALLTDRTMFIVPQSVGEGTDALFTFEIVDGTNHKTVVSAQNVGTTSWMPGYIYNYHVGLDTYGNVGVEVRESFDDHHTEKKDVRFELTKSSASYLRVAVVANWCLSNGKVFAAYDGGWDANTSEWVKGTDGFFYSKYPVLGHTESENLINQFKPKGTVPSSPYPLHLEMNILVQAISYDVKDVNDANGVSRAAWAWGKPFSDMIGHEISTTLR